MLDAHRLQFAAQIHNFAVLQLHQLLKLLHLQLKNFNRLLQLPNCVVFFYQKFRVHNLSLLLVTLVLAVALSPAGA